MIAGVAIHSAPASERAIRRRLARPRGPAQAPPRARAPARTRRRRARPRRRPAPSSSASSAHLVPDFSFPSAAIDGGCRGRSRPARRGRDQHEVVLVALSVTHGPFLRCTRWIAVIIVAISTELASGVAAPSDERRAAAGLGDSGGGRVALAGPQPDRFEHAGGGVEAVAVEPAEQLLGAVAEEVAADDQAKEEASEFHVAATLARLVAHATDRTGDGCHEGDRRRKNERGAYALRGAAAEACGCRA